MNVIKIHNPEKLFFTSDTHFSHNAILEYANRPFSDIKTHDEILIKNWNNSVPSDGIVIHQGDFSMGLRSEKLKWILESLNGIIYLIKGNHEKDIMKKAWARLYFENIQLRYDIDIIHNGEIITIIADHYPLLTWNKKIHGSYHTHGHCHGTIRYPDSKSYDVGVDANNYSPISYYDLMEKFEQKKLKPHTKPKIPNFGSNPFKFIF